MTDTKPYPGIPPGILDEELEKHMSESKGPFEASLDTLRRKWSLIRGSQWAKKDYKDAIRLLEAAGKIEKESTLAWIKKKAEAIAPNNIFYEPKTWLICKYLIAFLEILPEDWKTIRPEEQI